MDLIRFIAFIFTIMSSNTLADYCTGKQLGLFEMTMPERASAAGEAIMAEQELLAKTIDQLKTSTINMLQNQIEDIIVRAASLNKTTELLCQTTSYQPEEALEQNNKDLELKINLARLDSYMQVKQNLFNKQLSVGAILHELKHKKLQIDQLQEIVQKSPRNHAGNEDIIQSTCLVLEEVKDFRATLRIGNLDDIIGHYLQNQSLEHISQRRLINYLASCQYEPHAVPVKIEDKDWESTSKQLTKELLDNLKSFGH